MKILKWLFWKSMYLFSPRPKKLEGDVLKMMRTRSPWWKFEPYCFYNEAGKQWHICFTEEQDYTCGSLLLKVEPHFGMDSGNVTGLTIWDESLKDLQKKDMK